METFKAVVGKSFRFAFYLIFSVLLFVSEVLVVVFKALKTACEAK